MNKDDDPRHWKLGVFYYNPDNPSESVDKRNGIGSTINFGSKIGRRIMASILSIPVIIILLVFAAFRFF